MTILPVSTSTASEKLRTILLVVATAVELSAGEDDEIAGCRQRQVVCIPSGASCAERGFHFTTMGLTTA